jgi:hypothetical protein
MPNVVKGSKQQKMIVVPYRPWFAASAAVFVLVGFVVAAFGGAYFGKLYESRDYVVTSADNLRLSEELGEMRAALEIARTELAISGRGSIVDQIATEEVQSTVSMLRERIMQLEQEISFYRQVMAPDSAELGLIIAEFNVHSGDQSGHYKYKAMFSQAGAGERVLEGRVDIEISGIFEGEKHTFTIDELALETGGFDSKLDFRYFQSIEGELILPADFIAEQVAIRAESTEPAVNEVERMFGWQVTEE